MKDGGDKQGGEVASGPSLKGDLAALVKLRLNVFVLLTTFFGFLIAVLSQSGAWEWGQLWALVHTLVGTAAAAFGSAPKRGKRPDFPRNNEHAGARYSDESSFRLSASTFGVEE